MKNVVKGIRLLTVIHFLLMVVLVGSVSASAQEEPISRIEKAVEEIIRILEDKKQAAPALGEEKRSQIMDIVEKHFDFREMSKRTLARHWKARTADEQEQFVKKFAKLLKETYIKKIENYSGEKVIFHKQDIEGNKAIVYSGFNRNNVETPVNYKLLISSDQWMIYDVIIEGVSLVRNWRTQFDSIMSKEKFSGLMARLDEKINPAGSDEPTDQDK
jgi:phospholipid transport system substrate-binding protein